MNNEVAVPAVELDQPRGAVARAEAATARTRDRERTRRAEVARVTALVQYMLRRGADSRDVAQP